MLLSVLTEGDRRTQRVSHQLQRWELDWALALSVRHGRDSGDTRSSQPLTAVFTLVQVAPKYKTHHNFSLYFLMKWPLKKREISHSWHTCSFGAQFLGQKGASDTWANAVERGFVWSLVDQNVRVASHFQFRFTGPAAVDPFSCHGPIRRWFQFDYRID